MFGYYAKYGYSGIGDPNLVVSFCISMVFICRNFCYLCTISPFVSSLFTHS